jgi:hypothetical protein
MYLEVKPILFSNLLEKKIFLLRNKLKDIIYQEKDMLAIKYDVEQYKIIFDDKMRDSMGKYKASFLIISDRQFAYITHKLLESRFILANIKTLSLTTKKIVASPDFFEDDYDKFSLDELNAFFTSNISERIIEIDLQRNTEQVSIKVNGVISFSGVSNDEINNILKLTREAYNDSQS